MVTVVIVSVIKVTVLLRLEHVGEPVRTRLYCESLKPQRRANTPSGRPDLSLPYLVCFLLLSPLPLILGALWI